MRLESGIPAATVQAGFDLQMQTCSSRALTDALFMLCRLYGCMDCYENGKTCNFCVDGFYRDKNTGLCKEVRRAGCSTGQWDFNGTLLTNPKWDACLASPIRCRHAVPWMRWPLQRGGKMQNAHLQAGLRACRLQVRDVHALCLRQLRWRRQLVPGLRQ